MRNKLILFLVFFAFLTPSAVAADVMFDASGYLNNSMFGDVSMDHENFNAIYYLKNTGVVQGDSGQTTEVVDYRPGDNINRAEFLKMTIEGNDIPVSSNQESCFPDVPAGEWYTPYICTAKDEGWINGYPDGTFKPAQTINEIESIKILGEVTGWEIENRPGAEWYEPYLEPAQEMNIVPQEDIGALMTRGDIAELVFRNTQVDILQVPNYDPKWDGALFDIADIPITGPLAPGGLMGHGGPLGDLGISDDDGPFGDEGEAELLTPAFFDENYCYFSDQGDFSGDNLDFLKDYTQEDLDKYVEGSYADEYGKMFCYTGVASTHLIYFDYWMRDMFDWMCWNLPDAENKDYDEIFCWVSEKEYELPPITVASGPQVEMEVIDKPDFAILPDWKEVEILEFNVKSLLDQDIPINGVDLFNYGPGDAYGIEKLAIRDGDGLTYFDGPVYMTDWVKGVFYIYFYEPLVLAAGKEVTLTVYADFDWEDYNGEIQIGFWEVIFSNESIKILGEGVLGPEIGLEEEMSVPDEDPEMPMCYLPPEGADDPNKTTVGGPPPDQVELGEGMHLVVPINQQGETCAAAATYSSLRWLEEQLDVDNLVINGQSGYDKLIKLLYEDTWTLSGQYSALKDYINEKFEGCLKASYNTDNVTCAELKNYYDHGCDIPLGFRCTDPGDWIGWGHKVDIVDVQMVEGEEHKCQIIYANSQTPNIGETSGDELDDLGYGAYQRGIYDDEKDDFDLKAPNVKDSTCSIYGATYICIEDAEYCKNNAGIPIPE